MALRNDNARTKAINIVRRARPVKLGDVLVLKFGPKLRPNVTTAREHIYEGRH